MEPTAADGRVDAGVDAQARSAMWCAAQEGATGEALARAFEPFQQGRGIRMSGILRVAAAHDHTATLRELLLHRFPRSEVATALATAAHHGNADAFETLLAGCRLSTENALAMALDVVAGHDAARFLFARIQRSGVALPISLE